MDDTSTPRRSKKRRSEKEQKIRSSEIRASDASPPLAFGKRKKRSYPAPVERARSEAAPPPSSAAKAVATAAATAAPTKPAPLAPAATSLSFIAGLLPNVRLPDVRRLSWIHPHGRVIAAFLSCAVLTTAVILTRAPQPDPATEGLKPSKVVAEEFGMPTSQAMTLQGLAQGLASQPPASQPAQTAKASEAQAGIRIVDLPSEKLGSCEESIWPYIEERCLSTAKSENEAKPNAKSELKIGTKIGPRPIDSRSQPNPLADARDRNIPIGSLTAIAPAHPKVSTTDGVATAAPEERIVETRLAAVTEPAASTRRKYKSIRTSESVRTSEVADRTGSVKKKKVRQVADAGRKTSYYRRAAAEAPGMPPPFFFPFGLFSQAR